MVFGFKDDNRIRYKVKGPLVNLCHPIIVAVRDRNTGSGQQLVNHRVSRSPIYIHIVYSLSLVVVVQPLQETKPQFYMRLNIDLWASHASASQNPLPLPFVFDHLADHALLRLSGLAFDDSATSFSCGFPLVN